jgi:UDP-N-acetylmuramoyl-tripeptide--D-alanyl-D-alanine ligase
MRTIMLSELALCCEGRLIGADVAIESISIDGREAMPQGLFVALKGGQGKWRGSFVVASTD